MDSELVQIYTFAIKMVENGTKIRNCISLQRLYYTLMDLRRLSGHICVSDVYTRNSSKKKAHESYLSSRVLERINVEKDTERRYPRVPEIK